LQRSCPLLKQITVTPSNMLKTNKIKLPYKKVDKIKQVYPNIRDYFQKRGCIDKLTDAVKFWGNDTIQYAIQDKLLEEVTLVRRSNAETVLDEKIKCVFIPEWDRKRPPWW
jgi:hypothetical protein